MAKAKYAIDKDKNKVYMISHTKAIYDSNGQVLEDRLQSMTTESSNYTDTKVAELINGAPKTMDTLSELADAIENNETVVEALNSAIGTKANKTDVDTALVGKLDVDGDATNTTVGFTIASTRTNIATGETQSTLFGKIKKWFSDLKTVAFTANYSDLTGTPTNATASTSGFMSSADKSKLDGIAEGAQVNSVTGVKGDSETAYRTGNINITKSNVGLGNVPNVTTNSQTPTYSVASSLSALSSGETLSTAFGKIAKAITEFINHKNNKSNPHSVTKSQVGLGNVDNTSDANKPISTAAQNALNGKLDGSWSDANGYANISEISLDVSDLVGTVWGNLGSNNEFAGIYELGVQVSDNRDAILDLQNTSSPDLTPYMQKAGGTFTGTVTHNSNIAFGNGYYIYPSSYSTHRLLYTSGTSYYWGYNSNTTGMTNNFGYQASSGNVTNNFGYRYYSSASGKTLNYFGRNYGNTSTNTTTYMENYFGYYAGANYFGYNSRANYLGNSTSYPLYMQGTTYRVVGTSTGYNTKIHVSSSEPTMSVGDLWFKISA